MNDVRLRAAASGDLARMLAIEVEAARLFPLSVLPADVGRTGSPGQLKAAVSARLAWVAEADHRLLVGFLAAEVIGSALHIGEMDVLPAYGRRGIGGRLIEHAASQCKTLGLHVMTLTTFLSVPWNGPFYAKHGFQPISDAHRYAHLAQALAHESSRGLKDRVAMVRTVALP